MTTTINASTSSGLVTTPDNSGTIALQSNGTTIMTIGATGVTQNVNNAPAFSVYTNDSSGYFTYGTAIKVRFNLEEFDTNNCYDTSNYRFTPNVAGYYQFTTKVLGAWGPGQQMLTYIRKNGSAEKEVQQSYLSQNAESYAASAMFYLNGTTDYVEVYVYQTLTGSGSAYTGSSQTFFQGFMVRGA